MTIVDKGKDAGKASYCEYAIAETGLGEFEFSIRECGGQTCPQSIFTNPSIYEKCPLCLKNQKDRLAMNQTEPKKVLFASTQSKSLYQIHWC